jgi:rod shape-determining protein MreC
MRSWFSEPSRLHSKAFRTWQDRVAWSVIAFGLVLSILPGHVRHRLALPFQTVLLAPLRGATTLRRVLTTRKSENDRLSRLAIELAVENARLRTLARLNSEARMEGENLVRAPILVRDIATLKHYLIVSRGTHHGSAIGSPALTPGGVVGRVVAVGAHQSLVQTVLHPESRIAGMVRRSRASGIVRPASARQLTLDYIDRGTEINPGDTVVTSGLGGLFPRGLLLGTVESVRDEPGRLFKTVNVRPAASISTIEQVFLLVLPRRTHPDRSDDWLENTREREVTIPGETTGR